MGPFGDIEKVLQSQKIKIWTLQSRPVLLTHEKVSDEAGTRTSLNRLVEATSF